MNKLSFSRQHAKILLVLAVILCAVTLRVLPHPPNFAPITAIALFGGAMLPKQLGVWLPLLAIVVSDVFVGFHDLIPITWGAFAVIALASQRLLSPIHATRIVGITVLSSIFFFVVTNLGVWAQGLLYPRTASGLIDCFAQAIPFFRNTLLGDLFYTGVIFGAYYLAVLWYRQFSSPAVAGQL